MFDNVFKLKSVKKGYESGKKERVSYPISTEKAKSRSRGTK